MRFYLKWYLYGLRHRVSLVVLAFIPLVIFLLVTGLRYDRFVVKLALPVAGDTPLSVRSSPVAVTTVANLALAGGRFFAEELTPTAWRRLAVNQPVAGRYDLQQRDQWLTLISSLRLEYSAVDGGRVVISYTGPDPALGQVVTTFCAKRLVARIRRGRQRLRRSTGIVKTGVHAVGAMSKIAIGSPEIERHRSWWRGERLPAAAATLLVPLFLALVLVGYREFTDPAFKSSRQVVRYLDLPILGSLPNLKVLTTVLRMDVADSDGQNDEI